MSFNFSTPTTNAIGGNFSFGGTKPLSAATPQTPAFGSQAGTANPPLAFGLGSTAAAPKATLPTFGGFGTPAPAPVTTASPAFAGFGFTSTVTSAAAPTLSFGTALTTATAPAFNFTTTTTTTAPTTAMVAPSLSFAAPATQGTALSITTASAPTFGFGSSAATTTAQTTTAASLGLGGAFSFGKPLTTAVTNTNAANLNFGTTTTTTTAVPFNTGLGGGGIFGKPTISSTSLTAPAAPAPFTGLGGIDISVTQPKLGENKMDTIKVKETQVPVEIVKTVDALKQYIKEQKTLCSEVGRSSTTKFTTVASIITNLQMELQNAANGMEANHQNIKLLRTETSKAIQALEMAQRTQDTPTGLQFENNAPFQYFQCLVAKFEEDLNAFRQQIIFTEQHMRSLANPQNITPEELKRGLKQINEVFISIAGRLHEIHQKVEEQKQLYLNMRRYLLHDVTNVFEQIDHPSTERKVEPLRINTGPSPFSNITMMSTLNRNYGATGANADKSATRTF